MFKHTELGEGDRTRTRLSMEQLNAREMLTAVPMDVDGDGLVSKADASAVIEVLSGGQIAADSQADVNGDGNVNPLDALLILNNVSRNSGSVAANETTADLTFAVIGDYGDRSNVPAVAALVDEQSPDFIVGAGDGRYGSATYADIHGFFCDYSADVLPSPNCMSGGNSDINRFFAATGNHDYGDGGGISDYTDYFDLPGNGVPNPNPTQSDLYYDFVQGPVHIFVLDSEAMLNDELTLATQRDWLQAGLQSSEAAWQIVVLHHAPYSSGAINGSHVQLQFPYADWGVDLVLSGHDHTYERIERDGTTFIVNGLSGAFSYDFDTPIVGSKQRFNEILGAAFFTVSETELTGTFKHLGRQNIDSFVVEKTTGFESGCDYVGNDDGCDISDLNALYAGVDGVPTPLTNELITEWLEYASSVLNPLKEEITDIYVMGDADLNGEVDSDDLGLLLNSFGDTGLGWSSGNFNVDAIVDSEDLGLMLSNFNFDSAVEATSATIGCAEPGNCCGGVCSGCALWSKPDDE